MPLPFLREKPTNQTVESHKPYATSVPLASGDRPYSDVLRWQWLGVFSKRNNTSGTTTTTTTKQPTPSPADVDTIVRDSWTRRKPIPKEGSASHPRGCDQKSQARTSTSRWTSHHQLTACTSTQAVGQAATGPPELYGRPSSTGLGQSLARSMSAFFLLCGPN